MQTQPDQQGKPGGRRRSPLHLRPQLPEPEVASTTLTADEERSTSPAPHDLGARHLRAQLEASRSRAHGAASWLETSSHYARLINCDGVVPVTAKVSAADLDFLASARQEVLGLAELGLRLVELHQPLDGSGASTDPAAPVLRCRSCMWRWPCPTFRTLAEVMDSVGPA